MNNKLLNVKNKFLFSFVFLFAFQFILAQYYEKLIDEAQASIKAKDYCSALNKYSQALMTQEGISESNPYTFYYAAMSAAYCNDNNSAIQWLSLAQKKGLGNKQEEINYIERDSAFIKLHNLKEWSEIIAIMKEKEKKQKETENKLNKEWNVSIRGNALNIRKKNFVFKAPTFALYFSKIGTMEVPYLVFIPKSYNFKKPSKMIVYLHGGVVSTEKFNNDDYRIQQEPIFSIGDELNTIVVYPFGKKDFGWVNQQEAFDNIFNIIKQVKKNFKIDKKNIVIGGMSNGGTATFYYASQKPNIFKGFFAISSNPNVLLDRIKFGNLSQGKKLITLNAKDDSVYSFKEVEEIYMKNKSIAKDWKFMSINEGNHGFIYNGERGKEVFEDIIKELYTQGKN